MLRPSIYVSTIADGTWLILAIRIIHGNADRVTSHLGTERLFARLPHADKQFEVYKGYEHGMLQS